MIAARSLQTLFYLVIPVIPTIKDESCLSVTGRVVSVVGSFLFLDDQVSQNAFLVVHVTIY